MNLKLYSYNAHAINDTTNYVSWFSTNKLQGDARINNVYRVGRRPKYASKMLEDHTMTIVVQMKGTVTSQIDTLKTWFDIEDETQRKLIAKDTADSDKQWYVYATVEEMPKMVAKDAVEIVLNVDDPVWKSETENTDTWNIPATAATNTVTVAGNLPAHPRLDITPTVSGGSRYAYRAMAIWRNPNTVAMPNYGLNIVDTVWDTASLVAYDTNKVLINAGAGIDDSVTTIPYDGETGTLPTSGMAYVDTEQISYTGKSGGNLTGVTRGINGTTAAAHLDDAVIRQSLIQADGDDIRVFVNGEEVPRWFQDINTANTKIWVVMDFQPGISFTLGTAIASTGAITEITLKKTNANIAAIKKMPASGVVMFGSELFTYTGVNTKGRKLTGVTRAAKETSMAAHAVNDTGYWIEHEIYVYYGNQTSEAPETDDTRKPIFDLSSTNISWVYTSFADGTGLRAGSWKPSLVKTSNTKDPDNKSRFYTANNLTDGDPYTDMGAIISAWKSGDKWKAENATVTWSLFNPATFTTITATGEKYRYTTGWVSHARFLKSKNGKDWTTVWTEATPASASTWTALSTHSAVSIGAGYDYIKFSFSGSIGAIANNYVAIEHEAVTLALESTKVPQGSFITPASCYFLDATITNNTSGEWIKVTTSCKLNETIVVDCENKTAYLSNNNEPVAKLEFSTTRKDWLNLSVGDNTLQFDDVGTAGITIVVKWRDRNS